MTTTRRQRTGPRGGDTRGDILRAARESFGEKGYDTTSMRAVARAAGVDVALVSYYFGSKDALFAATMELPVSPAELIDRAFDAGVDEAGPRLVDTFLRLWDDPETGPAFVALFRSAASHEPSREMFSEFLSTAIVDRYAAHLPDHSTRRASLAASQLVGLAVLRYIIKLTPVVEMTRDELVADVGPTLQRYLTGPLTA